MTNFLQDIQFGFRMLLKSRGLAAIAIFALALASFCLETQNTTLNQAFASFPHYYLFFS